MLVFCKICYSLGPIFGPTCHSCCSYMIFLFSYVKCSYKERILTLSERFEKQIFLVIIFDIQMLTAAVEKLFLMNEADYVNVEYP